MRRALLLILSLAACSSEKSLPRTLSSFEVTLTSSVGSPEKRCLLPGTPTVGADLMGCPDYLTDALGNSVARVRFVARAIDVHGELLESYNSEATVKVLPGTVDAAFRKVRFKDGVATGVEGRQPEAAFRGSFGDAYLWLADENPPPRMSDTPGVGTPCGVDEPEACDPFGLVCANTTPSVGFDPQGLAYCTTGCNADEECSAGFFCATDAQLYGAVDTDGVCVRTQPSYAAGAAGPIYLVQPNLSDVSRTDSIVSSPFAEQFVEVKRGNMVVTAVRIDGFYLTDTCGIRDYPGSGQALCTDAERAQPPEFNHLFVFSFSRPDDLFVGDRVSVVSGPMTEFNGLTELGFPLWEVDYEHSPQPEIPAISLHDRIATQFPKLVERGEACSSVTMNPLNSRMIDCDFAMERLEAARVTVKIRETLAITPGSREATNLERFGQWPVIVDNGTRDGLTFQMITRENIPFFDPLAFGARTVNATVTGNLRQVAFNDRDPPIWIVEPRDQNDCPWCSN